MAELALSDGSTTALMSRSMMQGTSFTEGGVISWVDLAKATTSGVLGVFQRLSSCGVDPYTIFVGQAVCSTFRMGHGGRKRYIAAISALPSMGSVGKVLEFGFGLKHLVRSLSIIEEGGILVALCAALMSCYPEEFAADVLFELIGCHKAPEELAPSVLQWIGLLRACSGVLACTAFETRAEHYMQLDKSSNERLTTYISQGSGQHSCTDAISLAEAIFAIGQVSIGHMVSMTIVGSADGGWLAACAEWLFDLNITISSADGELLYSNCLNPQDVQVQVFFEASRDKRTNAIQTTGRVYRLNNGLFGIYKGIEHDSEHVVSGRVEWERAFSWTFGSSFEILLQLPQTGRAIGNAARFFASISWTGEGKDSDVSANYYAEESSGRDFLNFAIFRFPELQALRSLMEEGNRPSLEQALTDYTFNHNVICDNCNCLRCKRINKSTSARDHRFCLAIILETIITLTRLLLSMNVSSGLCLEVFPTKLKI